MLEQQQYWDIDRHYSKASQILDEAKSHAEKYQHDLAVRRAQEAFELLLKTTFLFMGQEPPKEHDLTKALYDASALLQEFGVSTQRIAQVVLRGRTLALWRDLAFYGDERLRVVGIFGESEAKLALLWAEEIHTICSIVKDRVWERLVKRT